MILRKADPVAFAGSVELKRSSNNLKVYDSETGGTEITFNGTDNVFAQSGLPKTLWLQGGANKSTAQGDHSITANVVDGPQSCDKITATVLWVDIEMRGHDAAAIDGNTAGTGGGALKGKTSKSPINTPDNFSSTLGVVVSSTNPMQAKSNIELVGVISASDLDFGHVIPKDPKNDTPSTGLSTVDVGFIWERRATVRHYKNGIAEPILTSSPGFPPQLINNRPDNSYFSNQDLSPDTDGSGRLVIVDNDQPSTTIFSGMSRRTRRANYTQWVTVTMKDGASNAAAAAAAERCSKKRKWSTKVDITRNNNGTPANEADDSLQFSDPANDGANENEVLLDQHVPITLDLNPPSVTGIAPASASAGVTVSVTISGTNFDPNAVPSLVKGGDRIAATDVNRVNSTTITCKFNLTGVVTGSWDVEVSHPDGESDTHTGFTVNP